MKKFTTKVLQPLEGNSLEWELVPFGTSATNKQNNIEYSFWSILVMLFKKVRKEFSRLMKRTKKQRKVVLDYIGRNWSKLLVIGLLFYLFFRTDIKLNDNPVIQKDDTKNGLVEAVVSGGFWGDEKEDEDIIPINFLKDEEVHRYVNRFKKIAKIEMERYGIPASVNMAQALIESGAGNSKLATKNHNHFGVKCFSRHCKKGHCSNFSDDSHKDFFRIYKSAWDSWRAHSKMIVSGRYKKLLKNGNNYRAWAKGYKKLGYATDKKYDKKLISVIKKYKLYELDK